MSTAAERMRRLRERRRQGVVSVARVNVTSDLREALEHQGYVKLGEDVAEGIRMAPEDWKAFFGGSLDRR